MRFLAGYVMRGRAQAVLVTAVTAVLSLLLPPLSYLSGAAVGVVTLRLGALPGLGVIAGATLALGVLLYLAVGAPLPALAYVAVVWLPLWALALQLRRTVSLAATVLTAGGIGAAFVIGLHAVFDEPAGWWREQFEVLLSGATPPQSGGLSPELMVSLSNLMTGATAAGLSLSLIGCLLLARWWQALLYNPGGFREEFHGLRLGRALGVATLILLAVAFGVEAKLGAAAGDLLFVALVLHLLQGLAVLHGIVGRLQAHTGWLVAVYALLLMAPTLTQTTLLLELARTVLLVVLLVGFIDNWADFRRRVAKRNRIDA